MSVPRWNKMDSAFPFHETILSRRSPSENLKTAAFQNQVDTLVSSFVTQASDWKSLAAMTAGGLAYRMGRISVMAMRVGAYCNTPLWVASVAVGLGSEVTAFEFTNRSLQTLSPVTRHLSPKLWSWSGPGGWKEGWLNSLVTFGTLKGFGTLAEGQNIILQHGFQDLGMVAGHQMAYRTGLGLQSEGSFAEQMVYAESVNFQLGAGMALGHGVTGGKILILERGVDFTVQTHHQIIARLQDARSILSNQQLQPGLVTAGSPTSLSVDRQHSSSKGEDSRVILMSSLPGEGNGNKPRSPGDKKDLSHAETEVGKFPASEGPMTPSDLIAGFGLPMMAGLGWLNWLISRFRPQAAPKALPESTASTALVPVKPQSIVEKSKEKPGKLTFLGRVLSLVRKLSTPKIPDDLGLVYSLRKAEGWEFPVLNESTYQNYTRLAQARSWPLKMLMARVLKNAPMEEVESWMERLFPGDLLKRIEWIQEGKIRGGWKLLLDSLRAKPWDGYRQTLLLDTIRELQVQEALPDLYALLKDFVGTYFNYGYRMDIFKTILSLNTKENALEFLDQQLQEPWLNEGGSANHESKKLRRRVLRLRTQLNWEITGDNEAALNEILQGEAWANVMRYEYYGPQNKKILKNIELLLRMGDTELLVDLYNDFKGPLLKHHRNALVAALIDHGKIDVVRNALSDYRAKLEGKFQYGYTEEAIILARAGEKEVAVDYLRKVLAREGCSDRDKIKVLETLVSMGEREWALELAQKLLQSPIVALRAAELMDQLEQGWDHSLRRPVPLLEDPYR